MPGDKLMASLIISGFEQQIINFLCTYRYLQVYATRLAQQGVEMEESTTISLASVNVATFLPGAKMHNMYLMRRPATVNVQKHPIALILKYLILILVAVNVPTSNPIVHIERFSVLTVAHVNITQKSSAHQTKSSIQ